MLRRISNSISKLGSNGTRRRKQKHIQTGQVQALEERTLPAGNVLASFKGGNLTIKGDNFDNNVEVIATGGGIRVAGIGNTTVNGAAFQDYSGSQFVPKNVKAIMKGGNDRVGVFTSVNGNVTMTMGSGGDTAIVNGQGNALAVGGNLKMNMGAADNLIFDQVFIQDTVVAKKTNVKGGKGTQVVNITNTNFAGNGVAVNLGADNDLLNVVSGTFNKPKFNGGGGSGDQFNWPGTNPASKGFELFV